MSHRHAIARRWLNDLRFQFARFTDLRKDLNPSVYVSRIGYSQEGGSIGPVGFGVYEVQLVQNTTYMVILNEFPGTFRIVPTHGGPQPVDPDYTWQGNSIGHWDGDTLVVDTIGFNDKTEILGFRHTDALHIVEKFSRPEFGTLRYETTIEDPNVWVKPWSTVRMYNLRTDLEKVGEFVCENNRDYKPLFGK